MAGKGGSSSGQGATDPNAIYTWQGADPGSSGDPLFGFGETGFDPKDMSKAFGNDFQAAYNQGPAVFDQSLYAGIGNDTQGLISGGLSQLSPVASGGWLSGGNPYFEQALNTSLDNTQNRMNQMFSASGRLGSSEHVKDMGKALSETETSARYQNFNDEYNRMLGAQQYGLGLSGLLDQNAQQQLTAENDLFRRQNDSSMNWVRDAMGAFGQGNQGGALPQANNPFGNLLSTGLGAAGAIGSLLPLLSLSDKRAKDDIKHVGKTKDGQKVYSWTYKGDPSGKTHMGLLAQEVQKKTPDAVVELPGGLLAVDYQKALREVA
jgi:hypothetical protein